MTNGVPPTARNARTGLSTPPTKVFLPRSKISVERGRASSFTAWFTPLLVPLAISIKSRSPLLQLGLQPARRVLRVVGHDNFRAGPLNAGQDLKNYALLIDPSVLRRRFHHRIFAAHVVGRHRNIESLAHFLDNIQKRHRGLHHNNV